MKNFLFRLPSRLPRALVISIIIYIIFVATSFGNRTIGILCIVCTVAILFLATALAMFLFEKRARESLCNNSESLKNQPELVSLLFVLTVILGVSFSVIALSLHFHFDPELTLDNKDSPLHGWIIKTTIATLLSGILFGLKVKNYLPKQNQEEIVG